MSHKFLVSGLTLQQESVFKSLLTISASRLNAPWAQTLSLDEADMILYAAERYEGRDTLAKAEKTGRKYARIAAVTPAHKAPLPPEDQVIKIPFKPGEVISAMNACALKLSQLQMGFVEPAPALPGAPAGPKTASFSSLGPASALTEDTLVDIELQSRKPAGANKASAFPMILYAIFRLADAEHFYKIKRAPGSSEAREIWCWPNLGLYWSALSEEEACFDAEGNYQVFAAPKRSDALRAKSAHCLPSQNLLWRAGLKANRHGDLLPWLNPDHAWRLERWPDIPADLRSGSVLRVLSMLTRQDATFGELASELRLMRREVSCAVNALSMAGCIRPAQLPLRKSPKPQFFDPEEALFMKGIAIRLSEKLYGSGDAKESA